MQISTRIFSGEMPKVARRNLPGSYAVAAIDCELVSEELRSINANRVIQPMEAGHRTLYEIDGRFLSYAGDVDVAEHPSANAIERLFLTDGNVPRQADRRSDYTELYYMGVPKPNAPPRIKAHKKSAETTGDAFDTFYVTTFVNEWGEEGDKSEPSTTITDYQSGDVVNLGNLGTASNPDLDQYNIRAMRVYRFARTGGSRFLVELPLTQGNYTDFISETVVSGAGTFSTEDFFPPPLAGRGLHIMSNGIALMFVGREVYVSEPFQPNAWPNSFTVNADVVGVSSFDNTAVILTDEYPELATIFDPQNINSAPLAEREPCVAKRSIVQGNHGVMYAAPSGLFYIGSGGGQMLTEDFYDKDDWQALSPHTFTAAYRDGQYIAFYGNAEIGGGWVFDTREQNAICRRLSQWASAAYVTDGTDDLYLITTAGTLERYQGGTVKVPHVYQSKEFGDGPPVALNSRRLLAKEFQGNLTPEEQALYEAERRQVMAANAALIDQRRNLDRVTGVMGGAVAQDAFGSAGALDLGGIVIPLGVTFAGDHRTRVLPPYSAATDAAAGGSGLAAGESYVEKSEQLLIYGDGDLVHDEVIVSNEPDRITYAERKRCWHYVLKGTTTIQQIDLADSISAMGAY